MNAYALRVKGTSDVFVGGGSNPHHLDLYQYVNWAEVWRSPAHANAARLKLLLGDLLEVVRLPVTDSDDYGPPEPLTNAEELPSVPLTRTPTRRGWDDQ